MIIFSKMLGKQRKQHSPGQIGSQLFISIFRCHIGERTSKKQQQTNKKKTTQKNSQSSLIHSSPQWAHDQLEEKWTGEIFLHSFLPSTKDFSTSLSQCCRSRCRTKYRSLPFLGIRTGNGPGLGIFFLESGYTFVYVVLPIFRKFSSNPQKMSQYT